jgi:hypothetical protein
MFSFLKQNNIAKKIIIVFLLFSFWGGVGVSLVEANPQNQNTGANNQQFPGTNISTKSDFSCGLGDFGCYLAELSASFFAFVAKMLAATGMLFNEVLKFTVFDMSKNIYGENTSGKSYIEEIWVVFRDIGNILIIFVLIYTGIKVIIKGNTGEAKNVPLVLIVALLINFSLYFTKLFVDVSNAITLNIYSALSNDSIQNPKIGITGTIVYVLNFQDLLNLKDSKKEEIDQLRTSILGNQPKSVWGRIWTPIKSLEEMGAESAIRAELGTTWSGLIVSFLAGSLVILVITIIFLIMSLFLISRFVVIILLLFSSALAVGSVVLPQLRTKIWDKWAGVLISQLTFPIVFMIMILITLKILSVIQIGGQSNFDAMWTNGITTAVVFNTLFPYILAVTLLIYSIVLAKSSAGKAGGYASSVTGFIGGAALSTTAFAGRKVLGGAVGGALSGETAKRLASSNSFAGKLVGSAALVTGAKLKSSTFDPRNVSGVSKIVGVTKLDKLGVSFGKGTTKTTDSVIKEKEEKAKKILEERIKRREFSASEIQEEKKAIEKAENKKVYTGTNTEIDGKTIEEIKKIQEAKQQELTALQEKEKGEQQIIQKEQENIKVQRDILDDLERIQKLGVSLTPEQINQRDWSIASMDKSRQTIADKQIDIDQIKTQMEKPKKELEQITEDIKPIFAQFEKRRERMENMSKDKIREGYLENATKGFLPPIATNWRSNRVAKEMLIKARKGESTAEKLEKLLSERQAEKDKEKKPAPPTPPPTTP